MNQYDNNVKTFLVAKTVFVVNEDCKVQEKLIKFNSVNDFTKDSVSLQKQFLTENPDVNILEASTKSLNELGQKDRKSVV